MAAGTALLCSTLLFVHVFVSADPKFITAESGQDVTLTCRAPNNIIITAVEWSRADLLPEYVLLYLDGHFVPDDQHPSFKNRVDLQDRQMKDGDASLILKNVTINDVGTYECRVDVRETRLWDLSIIYLSVVDPPGDSPPPISTPPPTSTSNPGSISITLPPSLSAPPLSVLLPVGSVYVVVLLVLLVLWVRQCVHRKLEVDGEDDIISSITYSVVKASTTSSPTNQRWRFTDSAVVYSAVRTEDVSYGQTPIRTRRPRCTLGQQ
ncbi:hypothetical protein ACER0C_002406 [Sarotherodon galilaeus]